MRSIRPVERVIEVFNSLPGIGPKTASRLAYYLLNVPQERLEAMAEALAVLRKKTKVCELCFNIGEDRFCPVCDDVDRDKTQVCVVESPLDLLAWERSEAYQGVYHVLGGVINPLAGLGPNDIRIPQLLARLTSGEVKELIIALNPNMEGEATAMYIAQKVRLLSDHEIRVTRIGRGLPTGADIEYADGQTLARSLEGRVEL
jgi:recombination protein RecR